MYIATKLLLTTLTTIPTTTTVDDLCDVVHRETGTPTICQPHKEGAPKYDANVCCAGDTCFSASGGCQGREVLYYCGLGEVLSTGEVLCYFEVPSYCDLYPCASSVTTTPQAGSMCCNLDVCWNYHPDDGECEKPDIYWCGNGMTNSDGTVTCFDEP